MSETSFDKWPVEIKVVKIAGSVLDEELNLYFVSGIMNPDQRDTLKQRLPIQSEFEIEKDKVVIATLVTHKQLMNTYEEFTRLAKEWRGAFYVVTNKYVEACKKVIGS